MITCGWGTRACSFVLCTVFSISISSYVSSHAAVEAQTTNQPNQIFDIKKIVNLGQETLDLINDLDYFSAQEVVVSVPTLNQELVIDWGFAGSGDLFTALPEAKSFMRNGAIAHDSNTPFNITELGVLLAQDALANKTKQLEMLSWLIDAKFDAFKVFCFKTFLLTKDYRQDKIDAQTMQNEVLRLLVRLSLSGSANPEDASKPLSKRLPKFIKELVSKDTLSLLDTTWSMVTASAENNDATARTVYASSFTSEQAANLYFDTIKKIRGYSLKGTTGIKIFNGITKEQKPKNMPQALHAAAVAAETLPQLINVSTNDGQHWIAEITQDQSITSTTKVAIAALIDVLKQYTAIRAAKHAGNPEHAEQLTFQQQASHQQARLVQAFLKTDAGAASAKRLEDAIKNMQTQLQKQIADKKKHDTAHNPQEETNAEKEAQLADLKTLEADLKKAGQPVPTDVKAQIKALEANLAAIANTDANKQATVAQRLEERKLKARAYFSEGKALAQELAEMQARINLIPLQQRKLAELRFTALQKPQYTAYMSELKRTAKELINQNAQAEELQNYRQLQKETNASLLPEATRQHIAELEAKVGWLIDGKPETIWLVGSLIEQNPELKELLINVNSTDAAYEPIRKQLFEQLSLLVEQSTHIKEHARVYGYFISKFFPAFLPLFWKIIQTAPAAH